MLYKLKNLKEHDKVELIQYLVLLLIFSISAGIFYQIESTINKFYLILATACLYVVWGYWHHGHLKRLDTLVIFEYFIVSIIVVLLSALGLGIIRFL